MATNSFLLGSIWAPIRRRTKAAYTRLFDNPAYLFGRGSRTIIFPNGAREIWIQNPEGTAQFCITAGNGAAGFSVSIKSTVGTLAADAHVMTRADYVTRITDDVREISFVAYYPDDYAQQFKRWYACDAHASDAHPHEGPCAHPDTLGMIKIDRVKADTVPTSDDMKAGA